MRKEMSRVAFRAPRLGSAFALSIVSIQLASCGAFGIPLKKPVDVPRQAQRSTGFRPGESTRDDARTALGEPFLHSDFWGFDLFRANDNAKEIGVLLVAILPIPVGYFTSQVEGYVLVAYDNTGRIAQVSSGNVSRTKYLDDDFRMFLRARDLSFGIDRYHQRGGMLMADANRLQDYLAFRRRSGSCTVMMACDEIAYKKWPYEACPDRVAIDDADPFDPRPYFGYCEPGRSCPPKTSGATDTMPGWMPTVHPVTLQPGSHRLAMSSSAFKGRHETSFECSAGEVRYGIIRGHVDWHWWGPGSSTLDATATFVEEPPAEWASYGILLFRRGGWLVASEPQRP